MSRWIQDSYLTICPTLHQNQLKKLSYSLSRYAFWGISDSFTFYIFSLIPVQPPWTLPNTCFGFHMLNTVFLWSAAHYGLMYEEKFFSCYATPRHFIFLSLWGRAENRFNWPSFCQRTFKVEIKMKLMMHLVHFLAWRWNCMKPQNMSSNIKG